jgi:hypothetical protein
LPDRAYDAVRSQIDHTRQRAVLGPWREEQLSRYAIYGIAAAAIVLVVVVGVRFLPTGGLFGGQPTASPTSSPSPTATASPSPSPTPAPTPIADKDGPLDTGVYVAHPFADDPMGFTFSVPSGNWSGISHPGQMLGVAGENESAGLGFLRVSSLNGDPCQWSGAAGDVPIGPRVDDLVTALASSTDYEATDPVATTVSGFSGRQLQLSMPAPLPSGCDEDEFRIWNADGFDVYAQGPSNRWNLKILDVGGQRVVVMAYDFADTPSAIQAELQAIGDSLLISP